jgi:hypothetical protein
MSSFTARHSMYLFRMKNGKRKLAYGESPQGALEILRYRLTPEEMAEIVADDYVKIHQRELQEHVPELG